MNPTFVEAFMIMITGMGAVFVFLLLLLAAMQLLSYFTKAKPTAVTAPAGTLASPPPAHIAPISAAVRRYRRNHK